MVKRNGLIVDNNGTKSWYMNDKLHRVDGPAVEYASGTKEWRIDGKRHRADGPAIEYWDGSKQWYMNGVLHRVDGPAIELSDGTKAWYYNDKQYTFSHWIALSTLPKDSITELVLYYG